MLHLWYSFIVEAISRCLHRQRFDGDVIPSSIYKDRVASGVVKDLCRIEDRRVRLHQPHSRGNVSRLTDYILVCYLSPSITCISIAQVLGLGFVGYEKLLFSAPSPNTPVIIW